jgi:Transposase DDE domain
MGQARTLIKAIEDDFQERHPLYHKSRRAGLTTLAGVMLEVRSATLMELAAGLPRAIGAAHDRYQYLERQLKNAKTDVDATIKPYARDVIERLAARGETVVLQMDQSHINGVNEVLMLAVRLRQRALPVAWRVRSTQGNIGFSVQQDLLDSVRMWIPAGTAIMLAADRFYGTAQLIAWCQKAGWSYRIRLKGNLTLSHQGGELTTGAVATRLPQGVIGAELYGSGVTTNIGVLHDKGHKEPWIIAMDVSPTRYTVLDDGRRGGIETLFADFKSRGFGLRQSHIQKPERLERLILIMSMALYWAVSCGACAEPQAANSGAKKGV